MKCLSKDRNNKPCRNNQINSTNFCKLHQHMCKYTSEMINSVQLCKGCKKMYYFENGNKTCDSCRTRDKSQYKKEITLCKKDGCTFKKSEENIYCGKHQIHIFIDETVAQRKKLCKNYIRGCKSQLDSSYIFLKCQECLESERTKDKINRDNAKELNCQLEPNVKICSICCKQYDISQFKGVKPNTETKTCSSCREQNQIQDKRRDKIRRNLLAKTSINQSFCSYMKEAKRRNIDFHLSKDTFCELIKKNCHYCGEINEEKKFNGIDRINSSIGYLFENCVSCCSLCNYLKNKTPIDIFMRRVQHIVSYLKEKRQLFDECFPDFISGNYKQYTRSARVRDIEFSISKSAFDDITKNNCYMCGKQNSLTHRNGIDRFDNEIGYIVTNCRSCCNTCNMTKNRYLYNDIISKFNQIIQHNNIHIMCL